jgi:hypothetical protein
MPDVPGRCFEPETIGELAGTSRPDLPPLTDPAAVTAWLAALPDNRGTFGAVGAPDVEYFFADVPRCLSGDYLAEPDDPPLMNLLTPTAVITPGLITSCFTFLLDQCEGRIDHDIGLGKDKGTITVTLTGKLPNTIQAGNAKDPRGKIDDNFQRAVVGAETESFDDWVDFSKQLIARYGQLRGTQMICAITHDDPVKDCAEASPATITIEPTWTHNPELGKSNICLYITTSPAQATATVTLTGPNGYSSHSPDKTALLNGSRLFTSEITQPGDYTANATAYNTDGEQTATTTQAFTVTPPPTHGPPTGQTCPAPNS